MTNFPCQTITEIKAYALAAKFLHPQVKAIIDIGGQDTKAILLDDKNNIKKFEMNDKCAAGTGKFLEIMALTLGVTIEELGPLALTSDSTLTINNTCTVFAESEVISLLTQGQSINNIANAIHHLVAHKAVSLINRVAPSEDTILFAGGVAHNPAVVALLKKLTNRNIIIPQLPEYMGAIGAAIAAKQE
jgi:predicted CoA-substrate-specific enzyme activase